MAREKKAKVRMNIVVDAELRYLLRIRCTEEDITLQEGVVAACQLWIKPQRDRLQTPRWARPVPPMPVAQPIPDRVIKPIATPEHHARGHVTVAHFQVPVHWVTQEKPARARFEMVEAGEEQENTVYMPPPEDPIAAGTSLNTDDADHNIIEETPPTPLTDEDTPPWEELPMPQGEPQNTVDAKLRAADIVGPDEAIFRPPPEDLASMVDLPRPAAVAVALPVDTPAVATPITAGEYEVPADWVSRDGMSRKENLRRYGEDETLEYWPPIRENPMDVDAPLKREEL